MISDMKELKEEFENYFIDNNNIQNLVMDILSSAPNHIGDFYGNYFERDVIKRRDGIYIYDSNHDKYIRILINKLYAVL